MHYVYNLVSFLFFRRGITLICQFCARNHLHSTILWMRSMSTLWILYYTNVRWICILRASFSYNIELNRIWLDVDFRRIFHVHRHTQRTFFYFAVLRLDLTAYISTWWRNNENNKNKNELLLYDGNHIILWNLGFTFHDILRFRYIFCMKLYMLLTVSISDVLLQTFYRISGNIQRWDLAIGNLNVLEQNNC